jgi:hypothetical protein
MKIKLSQMTGHKERSSQIPDDINHYEKLPYADDSEIYNALPQCDRDSLGTINGVQFTFQIVDMEINDPFAAI